MEIKQKVILIAGPTASGKTSHAIRLAQANDAVIINTDSMQIYADLRIITARPDDEELASAPHHLFGFARGDQPYSVAHWLQDVEPLLKQFLEESHKVIFVGGTGLYFNALLEGFSPMPDIKDDIRQKWRADDLTADLLHEALSELDPIAAKELRPSDRQRMIRALEVFESTGRSILDWQKEKDEPLLKGLDVCKILIMPERSLLHERINLRFDQMVKEGAVQEVDALLAKDLPPSASVMKAIGVPQFKAYLADEISLQEAIEKAKAATRQYAKRQCTWFNNSFDDEWERTSK